MCVCTSRILCAILCTLNKQHDIKLKSFNWKACSSQCVHELHNAQINIMPSIVCLFGSFSTRENVVVEQHNETVTAMERTLYTHSRTRAETKVPILGETLSASHTIARSSPKVKISFSPTWRYHPSEWDLGTGSDCVCALSPPVPVW